MHYCCAQHTLPLFCASQVYVKNSVGCNYALIVRQQSISDNNVCKLKEIPLNILRFFCYKFGCHLLSSVYNEIIQHIMLIVQYFTATVIAVHLVHQEINCHYGFIFQRIKIVWWLILLIQLLVIYTISIQNIFFLLFCNMKWRYFLDNSLFQKTLKAEPQI